LKIKKNHEIKLITSWLKVFLSFTFY